MAFVTVIDNDPGTTKRMTFSTWTLYDMAVEAHLEAALGAAWYDKQIDLGGHSSPPPTQLVDIERYLRAQYDRIKFLGTAINEYIELSDEEFKEYTAVRYRLKEQSWQS